MAKFIHKFETAHPNAKKSVHEIRPNDIIYVDNHPRMMSDPPKVSYVDSLSGPGYEDPEEEKVVLVRGLSVIDGNEYGQLYSYPFKAEHFVDKHDEREWLVVSLLFVTSKDGMANMLSFLSQKRREGMRLYLQSPRDPSNTWVMYMQPEKVTPCFWLLARGLPGKVCMWILIPWAVDWTGLTPTQISGFIAKWDSM